MTWAGACHLPWIARKAFRESRENPALSAQNTDVTAGLARLSAKVGPSMWSSLVRVTRFCVRSDFRSFSTRLLLKVGNLLTAQRVLIHSSPTHIRLKPRPRRAA